MVTASGILLVLSITVLVIVAHEATHLLVGFGIGTPRVAVYSWLPFKLQLTYPDGAVSPRAIRLMAIAPTLIGVAIAGISLSAGGYTWLSNQEPAYLPRLSLLYWLLYTHASPSDIRTFLHPTRDHTGLRRSQH